MEKKELKKNVFLVLLTLTVFFMLIGTVGSIHQVPLANWFLTISQLIFHRSANIFYAGNLNHLNIYKYFYGTFYLALFWAYLINKIGKKFADGKSILINNFGESIKIICLTLFCLCLALQSFKQLLGFSDEFRIFNNKPSVEKKVDICGANLVNFVNTCKMYLDEKASCKLMTDMDLTRDPGMITSRILAYSLYPIDIRGIRNEENNCILMFMKDNPETQIPEGFKIIKKINLNNLIAGKKL